MGTSVSRLTFLSMYVCSITEFCYHNKIPLFPEYYVQIYGNSTNMADKFKYF